MSRLPSPIAESAKTCLYPRPHPDGEGWQEVARKKTGQRPDFGARLRELRIAAGYTQQEIAQEVGVSRRMIAYYEGETERPPAALLPAFAAALGVSTDELLGVATPRKRAAKPDRRLQRRMQQIERMNPREKRQALQLLDALIEREQLRATKG
jgi:transcriptional regulator with XRE-family HTH domain